MEQHQDGLWPHILVPSIFSSLPLSPFFKHKVLRDTLGIPETGLALACWTTVPRGHQRGLKQPVPFHPFHHMQMVSQSVQTTPPELSAVRPNELGCSVWSKKSFKMYY